MLELAERLGNAGFRWLVQSCQPIEDALVADRLAQFEIEIAGLRGLCRDLVLSHDTGGVGAEDASVVKLFYSELLQRMTDFGAEIGGLAAHTTLTKPASSGWESARGCWTSSAPGSGRFRAEPARSSARSSPNAGWDCRANRV